VKEVRNGPLVSPTCPDCGCRLDTMPEELFGEQYIHYGANQDTDARGCRCDAQQTSFVVIEGRVIPSVYYG
jgi:hypothetical protein